MSNPVYPEDALPDNDPNPEGEDIDPELAADGDQGLAEPEDEDEADFDGSELL